MEAPWPTSFSGWKDHLHEAVWMQCCFDLAFEFHLLSLLCCLLCVTFPAFYLSHSRMYLTGYASRWKGKLLFFVTVYYLNSILTTHDNFCSLSWAPKAAGTAVKVTGGFSEFFSNKFFSRLCILPNVSPSLLVNMSKKLNNFFLVCVKIPKLLINAYFLISLVICFN